MTNDNWFSEARFGMMVHWGLYSLLAGEYKGEQMGGIDGKGGDLGEWAMTYFRIPIREYEKLATAFNPLYFDAEEWVRMAKDAGMNYIVITSKHHEGFALFKSENDPYNVVDATPFKRDIIAELSAACKKYGLKFGLYYSQELDWHEENGGGYTRGYKNPAMQRSSWTNNWDFPENDKKDFSLCFEKKIKPQVKEILTKYGDISLIWFDTPGVITEAQSKELYDLVKELQPDCLVNSRIGNGMGDYTSLGDNQIPSGKKERSMLYETAATINDTWGYKYYDHNWKTPEEVITLLTSLASRNVNYLLNVGPDHMGRIPFGAQNTFKAVGQWLRVNGEAVYGSEPSPYDVELTTGPVTAKGNDVYYILSKPEACITLPGITKKPAKAELLGGSELSFTYADGAVTIKLPDLTSALMPVVKLTDTAVKTGIIPMPDGSFTLSPLTGELSGGISISSGSETDKWVDESGCITWHYDSPAAGNYSAQLYITGNHGIEPCSARLTFTVNDTCVTFKPAHDHDNNSIAMRHHKSMISEAGTYRIEKGENTITLRLAEKVTSDMLRLAKIVFTPEK